jgi:hypothetical protein
MKPGHLSHAIWALVATIAAAVGYFAADRTSPSSSAGREVTKLSESSVSAQEAANAIGSNEPRKVEVLKNEEARVRTFQLLAEPNRLKRMRAICELLESVSPENWRGVIDAFMRQSTKGFRTHSIEWNLMIERVGEVMGAVAVEEAIGSDKKNDRDRGRALLIGWAAGNPTAATEWFKAQSPEIQAQYLQPFLNGLSRTDPQSALTMVMAQSQDVQEKIIPDIIDNAIQKGGFREAEQLLEPLIGRTDIDDGTRGKLFSKLAHRRITVGKVTDDPMEALDWFAGYLRYPKSPAGPMATTVIFQTAATNDPLATMNWLDQHADTIGKYHGDLAYPIVARALFAKAPEQFDAWIAKNPDHPSRDRVVEAVTYSMIQGGNLERAAQLAGTIRDPEIVAKVNAWMEKNAKR